MRIESELLLILNKASLSFATNAFHKAEIEGTEMRVKCCQSQESNAACKICKVQGDTIHLFEQIPHFGTNH
jgi:hypothetical protein